MPLNIVNQDILKSGCDIIVNPTDSRYSGSGGVDSAVHGAAGPKLREACDTLKALRPGVARFTEGFDTGCKYIIHTMGPEWAGGMGKEEELLRSCYEKAIRLARDLGAESLAFPLISSGAFGFPKDRVLKIATDTITDYLAANAPDLSVVLCVYDKDSFLTGRENEIEAFISDFTSQSETAPSLEELLRDNRVKFGRGPFFRRSSGTYGRVAGAKHSVPEEKKETGESAIDYCEDAEEKPEEKIPASAIRKEAKAEAPVRQDSLPPECLDHWLRHHDDSFALTLMKLIDKKGMTDVQCYRKANIDRRTFYKIRNDRNYRPSKATVLAFAIALELTLTETESLLRTVGLSLSHNFNFDLIVEFYIRNGIYDINEINAALFKYDQPCLGC